MWISDFIHFIFPDPCLVCEERMAVPGSVLCLDCEYKLPRTGFVHDPENPVSKSFWGRTEIRMATSMFRFEKGSSYQGLLHDLKYRGNRKAGIYLGKLLGRELLNSIYASCDILVPVPLHPRRLRERGYNQSELITRGVSEILGLPVESKLLRRHDFHLSQTSLGRFERYENVKNDFSLFPGAPDVNHMNILLVDDVLTTGATLEACSQVLLDQYSCSLYVATVCCA